MRSWHQSDLDGMKISQSHGYFLPLFGCLDKHDNGGGFKNNTFTHIYSLDSVRNTIHFRKKIQLMTSFYENNMEGLKATEKMVSYLVV